MDELRPPVYVPFEYRLYPFRDQERELLRQLDELKFLWNCALDERRREYSVNHRSVGFAEQCRHLAQWRRNDSGAMRRSGSSAGISRTGSRQDGHVPTTSSHSRTWTYDLSHEADLPNRSPMPDGGCSGRCAHTRHSVTAACMRK